MKKFKVILIATVATIAFGAGTAGAIPVGASGTVHATPCKWWC